MSGRVTTVQLGLPDLIDFGAGRLPQLFQPNLLLMVLSVLPSLGPMVFNKAAIAMITTPAITAYSMTVTPRLEVWICLIKAKRSISDNVLPPGKPFCGWFKQVVGYITYSTSQAQHRAIVFCQELEASGLRFADTFPAGPPSA